MLQRKNISNGVKKEYLTSSPGQTRALAKKIAQEILKTSPAERAIVIGLEGDLGGGKTTFLKGFARGLGIKKRILSPTFIIMRRFMIYDLRLQPTRHPPSRRLGPFKNFFHIDCYRVKNPKEILDLGFKKIISDPKNIVCIEWAERIKKILPKNSLIVEFKFKGKNKREITLN